MERRAADFHSDPLACQAEPHLSAIVHAASSTKNTLFSLLQLLSFLFRLKFLSSFTNSLNLGDLFSRLDHLLQKPLNQAVLAPKVLHYLSPETYCICFQIF